MDFTSANLQYLLALRELARSEPQLAGTVAGVPDSIADFVASLNDARVLEVAGHSYPLMIPRTDATWWHRLADAARDENDEEFASLLDNDSLFSTDAQEKSK
jgi:hypothetical protein